MLEMIKNFFARKKQPEAEVVSTPSPVENTVIVHGDVNVVNNISVTVNNPSKALSRQRRLDDALLEATLNYILQEGAVGVKIWRVQNQDQILSYMFLHMERMYLYLDKRHTDLKPGVQMGGATNVNIKFCIITSHRWQDIVKSPQMILTNVPSAEFMHELSVDDVAQAKKMLVGLA